MGSVLKFKNKSWSTAVETRSIYRLSYYSNTYSVLNSHYFHFFTILGSISSCVANSITWYESWHFFFLFLPPYQDWFTPFCESFKETDVSIFPNSEITRTPLLALYYDEANVIYYEGEYFQFLLKAAPAAVWIIFKIIHYALSPLSKSRFPYYWLLRTRTKRLEKKKISTKI